MVYVLYITCTTCIHRACLSTLLPRIGAAMSSANVTMQADSECIEYLPAKNTVTSKDENWNTEWLSLNVSIKCVNSLEEAMEHMGTHKYIYIINIHT